MRPNLGGVKNPQFRYGNRRQKLIRKARSLQSDVMVFWDFTDDTGKVILDMLKAGYLIGGKVKIEGVAVIEFGVDKRSGNGFDGVKVKGGTDAPKIMDVPVAGFTDRGDLVAEGEMTVE